MFDANGIRASGGDFGWFDVTLCGLAAIMFTAYVVEEILHSYRVTSYYRRNMQRITGSARFSRNGYIRIRRTMRALRSGAGLPLYSAYCAAFRIHSLCLSIAMRRLRGYRAADLRDAMACMDALEARLFRLERRLYTLSFYCAEELICLAETALASAPDNRDGIDLIRERLSEARRSLHGAVNPLRSIEHSSAALYALQGIAAPLPPAQLRHRATI